jgi:hypothetical protein
MTQVIPLDDLTPIDLGTAGNITILSKSAMTGVVPSAIVGDIRNLPITGAAIRA